MPLSEEPASLVDEMAGTMAEGLEKAIEIANERTGQEIKVESLVICIHISGEPKGEPNATVAAFNLDSPEDAIPTLITFLANAGAQLGYRIVPIKGGQG